MPSFTPEDFPEMEVFFNYLPEIEGSWDNPGYPEEFEFYLIKINNEDICLALEGHLIEYFEDDWVEELKRRKHEGTL